MSAKHLILLAVAAALLLAGKATLPVVLSAPRAAAPAVASVVPS